MEQKPPPERIWITWPRNPADDCWYHYMQGTEIANVPYVRAPLATNASKCEPTTHVSWKCPKCGWFKIQSVACEQCHAWMENKTGNVAAREAAEAIRVKFGVSTIDANNRAAGELIIKASVDEIADIISARCAPPADVEAMRSYQWEVGPDEDDSQYAILEGPMKRILAFVNESAARQLVKRHNAAIAALTEEK